MSNEVIDKPAIDDAARKFLNNLLSAAPVNDEQTEPPQMYRVFLHNDHSTMPEFVVSVLAEAFKVEREQAWACMMAAHNGGRSMVCVRPKDVAESQLETAQVMIRGAQAGRDWVQRLSPTCQLTFTIEPENKE